MDAAAATTASASAAKKNANESFAAESTPTNFTEFLGYILVSSFIRIAIRIWLFTWTLYIF